MNYVTIKHPKYDFYMQIDKETKMPFVIYYFDEEKEGLLNKITVLEEPEYFLLPVKRFNAAVKLYNGDYILDCECFRGVLNKAKIVCGGNKIKLVNNNYADLTIVLAKGQVLYGVHESSWCNESRGFLLVRDEFQEENEKVYHLGSFPCIAKYSVRKIRDEITYAPEYGLSAKVKVDNLCVYNPKTSDVEFVTNCESGSSGEM